MKVVDAHRAICPGVVNSYVDTVEFACGFKIARKIANDEIPLYGDELRFTADGDEIRPERTKLAIQAVHRAWHATVNAQSRMF